jgi:hypothetical protein
MSMVTSSGAEGVPLNAHDGVNDCPEDSGVRFVPGSITNPVAPEVTAALQLAITCSVVFPRTSRGIDLYPAIRSAIEKLKFADFACVT